MSAVLCRFVNTRGQRGTYFRRWFPSISVGVRLVLARQKTRLALSNLPANRDPRRPQSRLVWIDGGWGVDALLGHQTRKHDDLDVAVHHSNLSTLCNLLEDW